MPVGAGREEIIIKNLLENTKKLTSLDYEKISREVEKSCEKIRKETSEHLKKCEEEMKKEMDLDSKKYKAFSEDLFNEIFGDKGDLK